MDVESVIRASSLAELFWTDPDGAPDGCGVLANVWRGSPVIAFTYAVEARARAVASAPVVTLTLTDTRSTGSSFAPAVMHGRPRLVEDPDGSVFTEELLTDELRRYPPARALADSPMLRREHWWYLPRLLVVLDLVETTPFAARENHDQLVLAVAGASVPSTHVVTPRDGPTSTGRGPHGAGGPLEVAADEPLPSGTAAAVGQDASFPDLERWASWCWRGEFDGRLLRATQAPDAVGLPAPLTLRRRMGRQRALARACRQGIRRAERR